MACDLNPANFMRHLSPDDFQGVDNHSVEQEIREYEMRRKEREAGGPLMESMTDWQRDYKLCELEKRILFDRGSGNRDAGDILED